MRVGKPASGITRMRRGGASSRPRLCQHHPLRVLLLALAVSLLQAASAAAQSAPNGPVYLMADTADHLDLGAGVYHLMTEYDRHETFGADAEYRFGEKFAYLGPALGVIADAHGGGMAYGGLYGDVALGPVVLTPLAGLGASWHGGRNDENLGGTFEFRLSFEAAYRWDNDSRLGLRFGHISSAGIHSVNPGENDLMLTYALPLRF